MQLEVIAFLVPFVLLGLGVLFIAFSGGPGQAREAYLTRGSRAFKFSIVVLYVGLGIAIPALVIANRGEAVGGTDQLRHERASEEQERGKELFRQTCASCHALAAAGARGIPGPDLDESGEMTVERVLRAIEVGGTNQQRMPARLLSGENAELVAQYVADVHGTE